MQFKDISIGHWIIVNDEKHIFILSTKELTFGDISKSVEYH
jgi:hypothetical protein